MDVKILQQKHGEAPETEGDIGNIINISHIGVDNPRHVTPDSFRFYTLLAEKSIKLQI